MGPLSVWLHWTTPAHLQQHLTVKDYGAQERGASFDELTTQGQESYTKEQMTI